MSRGAAALSLLTTGLLLTGLQPALAAGPFDPAIHWRTVKSPHFLVHHPAEARNLGLRVSRIAEAELPRVAELFGHAPEGRIEIVITDAFDRANGSATVVPKNIIVLRLAAPTELTGLSSYDDWLRILIVHELAHICDIDQTHGITKVLAQIFGSYVRLNSYTPQFLTEGAGVYAETLLTRTGRGRSPFVDMTIRTAALDNKLVSIDRANIFYSDWPGGNAAYFYGGAFHLWLADRYGKEAVRLLHQSTAANPVPYVYWPVAKKVFGASLPELWERWLEEEVAAAKMVQARVRAEGETQSRRITFHGRNLTGNIYSPTGDYILYSRSSPVDGATVRRVNRDGSDDHMVVRQTYSPRFSFERNGTAFYFSQNAINARFNDFNDLYRYDIQTGEAVMIREASHPDRSLRARDPDICPNGRTLVFVQNALHQSWVSLGTFVDKERTRIRIRHLIPPVGDTQQASPRFSPDGTRVAVSSWLPGGKRDILVVDVTSGQILRRITNDLGQDGNPAWSPDGRFLLYESDTSGISNIYAYEWDTGQYYQVTNVVGGAYQADVSPNGQWLIFRNASGIGFDIHEIPFEPQSWWRVSYDPERGYQRSNAPPQVARHRWELPNWSTAQPRESEAPLALLPSESEQDYFPSALLPFNHNWVLLPSVFIQGDDPTLMLTTFVRDVLFEHYAGFSFGSSFFTEYPSWSATYINDTWYPTFTLSYGDTADSFPSSAGRLVRTIRTAIFGVSLPLLQRHVLAANYIYQHREGRDPLSAELLNLRGGVDFARLEFGYVYSNTRRYGYSVGEEDGGSLAVAGRWYSRALGGAFDELLFTLDGRGYINIPWFNNHVLALRGVAALAFGPEYRERFALGGAQSASFFTVEASQTYPLRGFPLDLERYPRGTGVLAAYLEYRFPIWNIERGLWTLPVFVDRIHGAVFTEGGNTFGNGEERNVEEVFEKAWKRLLGGRLGAGAELRADVVIGWAYPLSIRGGLAFPVLDRGVPSFQWVIPYVAFGAAI